jgi:serine O-acetyltransferase
VIENMVYDEATRVLDFADDSLTANTRCAYPLEAISNASRTGRAGHPRNVIMLTCDAFGVLPPIARLTPAQAMYHFLSGFTAKVAGTERGVTEPQPTFSTCFGAPFMPRRPEVYGEMLRAKIAEHGATCWLVNTGWTGGAYGTGTADADRGDAGAADRGAERRLSGCPFRRDRISASRCRFRSRASTTGCSTRGAPGPIRRPTTPQAAGWSRCSRRTSRSTSTCRGRRARRRLLVRELADEAYASEASIGVFARADAIAVFERDPACHGYLQPLLFFKGYLALQAYRVGHWLWSSGHKDLSYFVQMRTSEVFGVDIHPGARLGHGIMIDHAHSIVIGETAVVGDNVSMLHAVTLGGTGKSDGDRHPKIGNGVMIGAGAAVLGNISIGDCSRVAAGSVVLQDVPPCTTVAGVPARIVGAAGCDQPSKMMDQLFGVEANGAG